MTKTLSCQILMGLALVAVVSACKVDGFKVKFKDPEANINAGATASHADSGVSEVATYQKLKSDILTNKISTFEDLLVFFAKTPMYKSIVELPVLERHSGALHGEEVSPDFPRVLGHAGNITLHFTANPALPGHNLIEIIEKVPGDAILKFHLINMAIPGQPEMFLDDATNSNPDQAKLRDIFQLYQKTTGGRVFTCNACHETGLGSVDGKELLPNWNANLSPFRVYGFHDETIASGSDEYADFQKFLKTKSDPVAGKYYNLLKLKMTTDANKNIIFAGQPVEKFNAAVAEMAELREADIIQKFSKYENYQFMAVGALLDCPNLPDFMPDDVRAEHEYLLKSLSSDADASILVIASDVDPKDVRPEFFSTLPVQPPTVPVSEGRLIQYSLLPLIDTLGIEIGLLMNGSVKEDTPSIPVGDEADYAASEKKFSAPSYISKLAKLKYVFRGYYPELPLQIHSLINEVISNRVSPEGTAADNQNDQTLRVVTFAINSYRIGTGEDNLNEILELLGQKFLAENPALDLFKDHQMLPQNLTKSTGEYCSLLKEASLEKFKSSPLNLGYGRGKMGDLCAGKEDICLYPMACNDRGDGIKACTGSDFNAGLPGDLCGGPDANFNCRFDLTCVADDKKILRCQATSSSSSSSAMSSSSTSSLGASSSASSSSSSSSH